MHKKQAGFGAVLWIVVFACVGLIVLSYMLIKSKNKDVGSSRQVGTSSNTQSQQEPSEEQDPAPVLQNLGYKDVSDLLVSNDALREYDSKGLKGFYLFGDKLGGKEDTRINPNFEYASVKESAEIISAIDGIIVNIRSQGSNDYEIHILPSENSSWSVSYDHISNLQVAAKDKVSVGQVLGNPVVQNNGIARFELQINGGRGADEKMYCPTTLLATDKKKIYDDQIRTVQEQWNILRSGLYDLSTQNPMGCLKQSMTVTESQG